MVIVDAHCDTISRIYKEGGSIRRNNYHVDIERMLQYKGFVQFFACFVPPSIEYSSSFGYARKLIDVCNKELEDNNDVIMSCLHYNDIIEAIQNKKIACVLTLENGAALEGNLENLSVLYNLGIRSICLTWNNGNDIADGVGVPTAPKGLTDFGKEVIREMNRLGMIIDVSHMAERGFWDVLELSLLPVIASHSNSKKVWNHPRNLTDRQIEAIGRKGGVIGINLCPEFLDGYKPDIDKIIEHMEHILSVSGEDFLGIGCDFDGIDSTPAEIKGVQDIGILVERLLKMNYREDTVKKICGLNFLRVIQKICEASRL